MQIRSLAVLVFLAAAGCGADEGGAPSGQTPGDARATESGVSDGAPAACAVTREQLASYLPRSLLGKPAVAESFSPTDPDRAAGVRLDYGEAEGYVFPLTLRLGDTSRDPGLGRSLKASVLEASDADSSYGAVDRRTVDGVGAVLYTVNPGGAGESLTVLSDDLYLLLTHRETAGLETLLDALGEADVLGALERDCSMVAAGMPAWLDETETMAGDAPVEPPTEEVSVIDDLPGCDEILPPETVADICGVAATKARPTSFETAGRNCNRYYSMPGESDGLIFLLTNYGDARRAVSALRATAAGGENYENVEPLPDLGQGGERYLHVAGSPTHTVRFASHGALAELRNTESPLRESQYCMDLDQIEAIGRAVDENLAASAR